MPHSREASPYFEAGDEVLAIVDREGAEELASPVGEPQIAAEE